MKIIKYLILFIFITKCYLSFSTEIDSTRIYFFRNDFNNLTLGNIYSLDSVAKITSHYDKLDQQFKSFQTLSNSGLAHKDIAFSYFPKNTFSNSLPLAFNRYLHSVDKINLPINKLPFTDITYMSGDNKEQYLEFLFCREFLPRFFISINYDVDYSPGVYKRSKIKNSFFNGNFRYNTLNNRYGIIGYYYHDKVDIQENGGIKNDYIFENNSEADKSVLEVNLSAASNFIKSSGFAINQYFNIHPNIEYDYDSISNNRKIDLGRINHKFSYEKCSIVYQDLNPKSIFYQDFDPIISQSKTFDSIGMHNVRNVLYWNTLGYRMYNNDVPFYLTLGLEHNYTYHAGYVDILTHERFNNINYSNIRANAGVVLNILKSTRITANSQVITNGYHAGDFYIDAQWKQFLGTTKKNIGALILDMNINRQSATWFEEYYYSNNFRWDNDFNQETYLQFKVSYLLPFFELGLKQTNINDYIYFGTDAKPQQYTGNVSISTLYSTFNIKLNKFETTGYASFQITNNDKIIHLPYFQGKIKFAYNIDLVKNISMMQPSIVINYFTSYYADAYMPALRTFYLQDDVKVGNYPYIDLCVTFKLKEANIFVLYTNMYSLTGDNRYYTTPHYPMRDSRLCFGVNWRLYK